MPGYSRVKLVLLDVAGTLVRVKGSVGEQYATVAARHGVRADAAALDRAFRAAFGAAPAPAFPGVSPASREVQERRLWHGIVREVFERTGLLEGIGAGFDAVFAELYAQFSTPAAWEVYPDAKPALAALKGAGYRLGVLTNFDSRVVPLLEQVDLLAWFDSITLSTVVGAAKPERAIFSAALEIHGVEASEAAHVGDSPDEDVEGARRAGLLSILIDRRRRQAPGVVTIASLTELVGILQE